VLLGTGIYMTEQTNFTDLAAESENLTVKTITSKEILTITMAELLSNEETDKILATVIDDLWMKTKVIGDKELHVAERQKLRGEITGFPFEGIRSITKEANDTIFDFNLLGIIDQDYPQIFRYKTGDYYILHVDINPLAPTRKLSFIINLSCPETYTGGEVEFLNTQNDNFLLKKQGSITIFPSFLPYKINPITSGEKIIVVGHIHGSLFR
jgi:predicted 2-oxoglutarate/Fe(II)-dependent dioxygenase YbiX